MESQVLSAGSLFVSHLCPPTLSDLPNVSEPVRFSAHQLLDRQYDEEGWNWLIVNETEHSQRLLDSAIEKWPSSPIVYHRRALFDIYRNNISNAFQTYIKGLELTRSYDLYQWFLSFLYHKASVHEYILYTIKAVEQVGLDHRSGPLWRDLATIYIKIHNTSILSSGQTQGLVPDLFFNESTTSSAPLIPSQVEQSVFKGLAPVELCGTDEQKPYIVLFGDVHYLRKLFHRWIGTPTLNMAKVWEAYCTFERSVGGAGLDHGLASKMMSDYEAIYSRSLATYDRLIEHYNKLVYNDSKDNLNSWLEIIEFEKSNPIGLESSLCNERVIYSYNCAINYLPFCAQLWYDFFQFNITIGNGDSAAKILQLALEKFLPNHAHLGLALALYSEKFANELIDLNVPAEKLEDYLLGFTSISALFGITSDKNAQNLKFSAEVPNLPAFQAIQLLNFVRRWKGGETWRSLSEKIMNASGVFSWQLAWYMSTVEIQCYNNLTRALHILSVAQELLPFDCKYTLQHFYLLASHGKLDGARTLATTCLVGDKAKCEAQDGLKTKLWLAWLNMELFYGTKDTLKFVENAFIKYKLGLNAAQIVTQDDSPSTQILAGLPWNQFTECVEWTPTPLKLFSSIDDTDDSTHSKCDFTNLPVIVRPDLSMMAQLDVRSTAALETKSLLHSSQRPPFPPSIAALDSIVTPPKAIFDLLCILPTPEAINSSYKSKRGLRNPTSATDVSYLTSFENVDYLLSMIVSTDFNVAPGSLTYTPLPLDHFVKIRDSAANNASNGNGGNLAEDEIDLVQPNDRAAEAIKKMKKGGGIGALLEFLQNNT